MKKKVSVTIGIPAFNEEARIGLVLSDVRAQEQSDWELESVKVFCDGCTDQTAFVAKKVNWSKVEVIDDLNRKGKTARLQQLFQDSAGDLIVTLDADIRIAQPTMISELIKPFVHENVVLTGGNSRPFSPQSFFERAVFSSFAVFESSRKWHRGGNNVFGCTGSCMAIRRSVAQTIHLPKKLINEDAYVFMFCTALGKFCYCEKAIVEYSLPKNTTDYVKQVLRSEPTVVELELLPFFGERAHQELSRAFVPYAQSVVKAGLRNPLGVLYLFFLNSICLPFFGIFLKHYNLNWFTAQSTKGVR